MRVALCDVHVAFGSRVVLDGVWLSVSAPSLTAVTGPSGSGKSTLLAVLSGLLEVTSGERRVSLDQQESELRCAWILQTAPLLTRRSALANVALGPLGAGLSRPDANERAREAMSSLGVDGLRDVASYRLSGGERQRVVVARGIATGAQLVLADEPTASLDAANRDSVCAALAAAAGTGCAVVIATHDPVVAGWCERTLDVAPRAAPVAAPQ